MHFLLLLCLFLSPGGAGTVYSITILLIIGFFVALKFRPRNWSASNTPHTSLKLFIWIQTERRLTTEITTGFFSDIIKLGLGLSVLLIQSTVKSCTLALLMHRGLFDVRVKFWQLICSFKCHSVLTFRNKTKKVRNQLNFV